MRIDKGRADRRAAGIARHLAITTGEPSWRQVSGLAVNSKGWKLRFAGYRDRINKSIDMIREGEINAVVIPDTRENVPLLTENMYVVVSLGAFAELLVRGDGSAPNSDVHWEPDE